MEFATRTIHAGQPSEPGTGSLVAPIFQTSTFEQDAPGVHQGFDYSRTNNPTRARLETVLADLEGVAHAAVFASGLAAENAVLQAFLKPGDEIVIPPDVYGGTYRLLTRVFQPIGCTVRQVDVGQSGRAAGRAQPADTAGLDRVADQSAASRLRHRRHLRRGACAPARSSSSTTPSRRRSSSSRSRSAPTSSFTA